MCFPARTHPNQRHPPPLTKLCHIGLIGRAPAMLPSSWRRSSGSSRCYSHPHPPQMCTTCAAHPSRPAGTRGDRCSVLTGDRLERRCRAGGLSLQSWVLMTANDPEPARTTPCEATAPTSGPASAALMRPPGRQKRAKRRAAATASTTAQGSGDPVTAVKLRSALPFKFPSLVIATPSYCHTLTLYF